MFENLYPFIGVVIGALLAGGFQYLNTKKQLQNDIQKLRTQIIADKKKSSYELKSKYLLEWLPELIYLADPEAHAKFDYQKTLQLVHKIQLILNPEQCRLEAELNNAVSNLASLIQSAICDKPDNYHLLGGQDIVIKAGRNVLKKFS
ncbi:hypothetical protein ACU5DF_02250 [Aliivibrio wodanis]|uniref:DUF2489 domain-containing protein n=1 Tax=Aliivibrio sifiae TaxID=566293 RepID=A0A2S7X2M0_9GAMM|nr:hypothetical protein [Aliivibrio sifiae]PQJ84470.1 hypothetical protein BTO22_13150 [Aliivibrio sifiae]